MRTTISTVIFVVLLGCNARATDSDAGIVKPDAELVQPTTEIMKPDAGVPIPDEDADIYDPTMHPDFVGC